MKACVPILGILLFVTACEGPLNNPSPVRDPRMTQGPKGEPATFVRYDEMEPARAEAIRRGVERAAARSQARAPVNLLPVRYAVSVHPLNGPIVAIVVRDPAAGAMVILSPTADDHILALADAALDRDVRIQPVLAKPRMVRVERNGTIHDASATAAVQIRLQVPGAAQTALTAPMIARSRSRPAENIPGIGPVKFVD